MPAASAGRRARAAGAGDAANRRVAVRKHPRTILRCRCWKQPPPPAAAWDPLPSALAMEDWMEGEGEGEEGEEGEADSDDAGESESETRGNKVGGGGFDEDEGSDSGEELSGRVGQ